jgi:hypothetical protein
LHLFKLLDPEIGSEYETGSESEPESGGKNLGFGFESATLDLIENNRTTEGKGTYTLSHRGWGDQNHNGWGRWIDEV